MPDNSADPNLSKWLGFLVLSISFVAYYFIKDYKWITLELTVLQLMHISRTSERHTKCFEITGWFLNEIRVGGVEKVSLRY